jgi:DNA-binding NtrC family response regulator
MAPMQKEQPVWEPVRIEDVWPIHVLVVDDEPLVRMSLADALREAGFTIIEASNADEALGHLAFRPCIDLVITDVFMPGSMDGLQLVNEIRERGESMAIIVMSGYASSADLQGDVYFMPKPFLTSDMIAMVGKRLRLQRRHKPSGEAAAGQDQQPRVSP